MAEYMRDTGAVLPWEEAKKLVHDATELLARERTLQRIEVPPGGHVNVVGDVHGQFFDLWAIWEMNGLPGPENPFLFNGDFVDRGSYSVETLLTLLAWKVAHPEHFRLSRGNHEAHNMNVPYGFTGEVLTKYTEEAYFSFLRLFSTLPLGCVINGEVLVVHAGLPRDRGVGLADIDAVERTVEERPKQGDRIMEDVLWSDPCDELGQNPSPRGAGVAMFGPDVTEEFLEKNNLNLLIRSHEVKDEGFEYTHDGKCVTVFSAPNYCDQCGNEGAVICLKAPEEGGPLQQEVRKFNTMPRPDWYVPSLAYSLMNPASKYYLSPQAFAQLRSFYA